MDVSKLAAAIAGKGPDIGPRPPRLRQAVSMGSDPADRAGTMRVTLDGTVVPGVSSLVGPVPSGQPVWLLESGGMLLVLGRPGASPGGWLIDESTFSAAGTVSFDNVFTTAYDSYRVVLTVTAQSATTRLRARFRAGGSDITSGYYWGGFDAPALGARAAVNYFASGSAQTSLPLSAVDSTSAIHAFTLDVIRTSSSTARFVLSGVIQDSNGATWAAGQLGSAVDGITFYPSTGNITGAVQIYGYNK